MTINPFELLGVDPHKTTVKELRRAYYDIALLVHPDKNSDKSGDEMHVLHNAYKYCLEQVESVKDRETTYENLEDAFAEFCKIQTDEIPKFRDIVEDVLETKKFNDAFQASHGFRASFAGGYGEFMESSSYARLDTIEDIETGYVDKEEGMPLKNDFSSMIVYTEPISFSKDGGDYLDYERKEPVDSYTLYMKSTCLTDYKEANAPKEELNVDVKEHTLEELIAEREEMDIQISQIKKTY